MNGGGDVPQCTLRAGTGVIGQHNVAFVLIRIENDLAAHAKRPAAVPQHARAMIRRHVPDQGQSAGEVSMDRLVRQANDVDRLVELPANVFRHVAWRGVQTVCSTGVAQVIRHWIAA